MPPWLQDAAFTKGQTSGVHGESVATAVPRKTLVAAFDTRMTLLSTQSLSSKHPFFEIVSDYSHTKGFVKVAGP